MTPAHSRADDADVSADAPNLLAHCDALDLCSLLPAALRFDLVYLDPPYGVGAAMTARTRAGEARGRKHKASGPVAYEDGADVDALVAMLVPRLAALRDRMSDEATLWLHLDHRAVHDAKVAADRVFGRGAFLGDVVWTPGNGARGARGFSPTHQTILLYAREPARRTSVVWNHDDPALREPFAATSLAMHFKQVDDEGRRYRDRTIGEKTYRYYADEGRRLGSVWTDLPAMTANTPLRKEATGYPTQKPEKLLERIVRASSRAGAVVCDPMCGSGTTLVAAAKLGRRFVGGDASPIAISVASERLATNDLEFKWLASPEGTEASRPAAVMPRSGRRGGSTP
jgi:site-specific DNA-methyltransferase (adenine-specific)